MRTLLSGLVIVHLLGCYRGGVERPTPSVTRADSTAWRRILAPAIVKYLLQDGTSAPSQINPREPASRWTRSLVFDVYRQLTGELGGRSVDDQRTVEILDPVPASAADTLPRGVLIQVLVSDAHCTATPSTGQGAYYGAALLARVVQRPDGLEAEVSYTGNFDGICSVESHRR